MISFHQHIISNSPIAGTKSDLRNTLNETISREEVQKLVKEVKADGYVECSSYTKEGLDNVFNEAVKLAAKNIAKNNKCVLSWFPCVLLKFIYNDNIVRISAPNYVTEVEVVIKKKYRSVFPNDNLKYHKSIYNVTWY